MARSKPTTLPTDGAPLVTPSTMYDAYLQMVNAGAATSAPDHELADGEELVAPPAPPSTWGTVTIPNGWVGGAVQIGPDGSVYAQGGVDGTPVAPQANVTITSAPSKVPEAPARPPGCDPSGRMPANATSLYGNVYRGTNHKADHWMYYPDVGWVHKVEAESFVKNYLQDRFTGRWHICSEMVQIMPVGGDSSTVRGKYHWAHKGLIKERGLVKCAATGYYTTADDLTDALNEKDVTVKVSSWFISHNWGKLTKCDITGGLYIPTAVVRIMKSTKYKHVCAKVARDKSLFKQCPKCGHTQEAQMVSVRQEIGEEMCNHCYVPYLRKNAIAAWNDKHYPDPIAATTQRYGSVVGADGLIKATHTKESVPIIRLFGVEVETELSMKAVKREGTNRFELAIAARKALGADFAVVKEDGSLTANGKYSDGADGSMYAGFEIVSAPADIDTHRKRWTALKANMPGFSFLRAWDTDTCGFHVHVSRDALTTLQIGRILVFVNAPGNEAFVQRIAGRDSSKWCRYLAKTLSDPLHPDRVISPEETEQYNRGRRVAVNLTNPKTIEFRIFRGTINPKHIIRNIEFVDAVCDFCYPASRSLVEYQGHTPFIAFVSAGRKRWPLLAEWFAKQELISVTNTDKADQSKLTLRPDLIEEHEIPKSTPEKEALIEAGPSSGAAGSARPVRGFIGSMVTHSRYSMDVEDDFETAFSPSPLLSTRTKSTRSAPVATIPKMTAAEKAKMIEDIAAVRAKMTKASQQAATTIVTPPPVTLSQITILAAPEGFEDDDGGLPDDGN